MSVILLLEPDNTGNTVQKVWNAYNMLDGAMSDLLDLCEDRIRNQSNMRSIQYTANDLLNHFDQLYDVSILEEDVQNCSYLPRDRAWIKKKLLDYAKRSPR